MQCLLPFQIVSCLVSIHLSNYSIISSLLFLHAFPHIDLYSPYSPFQWCIIVCHFLVCMFISYNVSCAHHFNYGMSITLCSLHIYNHKVLCWLAWTIILQILQSTEWIHVLSHFSMSWQNAVKNHFSLPFSISL